MYIGNNTYDNNLNSNYSISSTELNTINSGNKLSLILGDKLDNSISSHSISTIYIDTPLNLSSSVCSSLYINSLSQYGEIIIRSSSLQNKLIFNSQDISLISTNSINLLSLSSFKYIITK